MLFVLLFFGGDRETNCKSSEREREREKNKEARWMEGGGRREAEDEGKLCVWPMDGKINGSSLMVGAID